MAQIFELVKLVASNDLGAGVIVASAILLTLWGYGKFVSLLERSKHTESCVAASESRLSSVCDRLDKRIEDLRTDMHEVRGGLQYVKSMMNSLVNASQSGGVALVQAHSPLALTEPGRKAAADMSATTAVATNWERIKAILDAEAAGTNPYDIQTFCLERIPVEPERFFDKGVLDAFKVYAFNHGRTLFDCLKVVGVIVRDKCFEERGIPLASLDAAERPKA